MSKVGEKSTSRFGKLNTPKLGKKITQQVFKTKLGFVDVDVEREWPELRGAGIQEGLYNEVVRTRGQPVSHLIECTNVYTQCLDFMHRYPYKEEKRHMESIWLALGEHARYFINFLWTAFESKRPFGNDILDESLLEAAHNFLQKLFALVEEPDLSPYLSSFQEEEAQDSDDELPPKSSPKRILSDLFLSARPVEVITHCLFFAETDTLRRKATSVRDAMFINDVYEDVAETGIENYYRNLLNPSRSNQRFEDLLNNSMSDECLFEFMKDFTRAMPGETPYKLLGNVMVTSISLLGKLTSRPRKLEYRKLMERIEQPNRIIREYLELCGSKLDVLTALISTDPGAELIGYAALLFAQNFDLVQAAAMDQLDLPLPEGTTKGWISEKPFLFSVIFDEFGPTKTWSAAQQKFIAALANKMKDIWHGFLKSLRELLVNPKQLIPEQNAVPIVIELWSRLGTLIGIHHLVSPLAGCCYAECPSFMVETEKRMLLCGRCRTVQYCDAGCQKKDWTIHKHHCGTSKCFMMCSLS
ncbi:hypothetical protein M413DRAFT_235288 [Hebeloma cylindrosporum]|uniref:MYND-type domain-containing protein n=1 Tax=Hebeloma cylindrosporum TaxID=76867 RepID=A0A0C2YDE5_HEBCY|nr:hypothetical protein M413DRAFT_235288 [Hebeloma cylindrosporum h7]